jgi:hypothetical protein
LAAGDLDARIADLQAQDTRCQELIVRVREQVAALRDAAQAGDAAPDIAFGPVSAAG